MNLFNCTIEMHYAFGALLETWALKDLNLRPTDYESAALTAELRARAHSVPLAALMRRRSAEREPC